MIETSEEDLGALWEALGVSTGDTIFVHSFLPCLGRLTGGIESVKETLLSAVGPTGNLIVPTFSYSIFRGECFDVQVTPSRVGALGDSIRTDRRAVRSADPAFSMAAIGPLADSVLDRTSTHAFGCGTIYDRLMSLNTRAILSGVGYEALSLFMHIERLISVPYRYEKRFAGRTRNRGREYDDELVHFVRRDDVRWNTDRSFIGTRIDDNSMVTRVIRGAEHRLVDFREVERISTLYYYHDPMALIGPQTAVFG